jgi:hypothetical protein
MFFDNKFICPREANWISEKCVQQYMITLRMPMINVIYETDAVGFVLESACRSLLYAGCDRDITAKHLPSLS